MRGKVSPVHTSAAVWQVEGDVVSVYDGDTLTARVDLGWKIFTEITIRLDGIDTPELPTLAGENARLFLSEVLKPGTRIIVTSKSLDKYGRTLASVMLRDTGSDVASKMLAAGHAVHYDGGKRATE